MMTETTKRVFEQYQIRKTKKQKQAFADYVASIAEQKGYSCHIEKGMLGARNIVIGSPDDATVIYTAHYDTCPRMPVPNFITPKNFLIYLLYQLTLAALIFVAAAAVPLAFVVIAALAEIPAEITATVTAFMLELSLIAILLLLLAGPANRHTANDNTSGVTTLLDIMCALPEEQKDKVAFVFFDLEEMGLFGSMGFASNHRAAMKNKPLINFDCVSDGAHILFALTRGAKRFAPLLEEAFAKDARFAVEVASKGVFYPSDQMNFPCGIGVAALKRTKHFGLLYMDRIHTKHDIVYCEQNIEFLVAGAVRFASIMHHTQA